MKTFLSHALLCALLSSFASKARADSQETQSAEQEAMRFMASLKDSPLKQSVLREHPESALRQRAAFVAIFHTVPCIRVSESAPPLEGKVRWLKGAPLKLGRGKIVAIELWRPSARDLEREYPDRAEALSDFARKEDIALVGAALRGRIAIRRSAEDALEVLAEEIDYPVCELRGFEVHQVYEEVAVSVGHPCLMLVDGRGIVAWVGKDLEEASQVVKQLRAGTHDLDDAREADDPRVDQVLQRRYRTPAKEQTNFLQRMTFAKRVAAQREMPEQNLESMSARMQFAKGRYEEAWARFARLPEVEGPFYQQVLKNAAEFLAAQALSGRGDRDRNLDLAYELAMAAVQREEDDWPYAEGGLYLVLETTAQVLADRVTPVSIEKRPVYEERIARHEPLLLSPPELGLNTKMSLREESSFERILFRTEDLGLWDTVPTWDRGIPAESW